MAYATSGVGWPGAGAPCLIEDRGRSKLPVATNSERRGGIDMADASATTFGYTGDFQTYTVPQGVSRLQLTVTGATGGSGYGLGSGGGGGASAQVTGFVHVTA